MKRYISTALILFAAAAVAVAQDAPSQTLFTNADLLYGDPSYAIIQGVKQAELMLTLAGPTFRIKTAVDNGLIPGPRI